MLRSLGKGPGETLRVSPVRPPVADEESEIIFPAARSASPRGIAAVVGAKNMPPAYFLHAPTPHIGAATVEAQKRIGQEIVEIIAAM